MQGVEPRLYRLDNVLGAAPWLNRKPVIVVESKACVERLWSTFGGSMPATSSVGGLGRWEFGHTEQLKDNRVQDVAIIPDARKERWDRAYAVARSCAAAGLRVRMVFLPDGMENVCAYFEAGREKRALEDLILAAPSATGPSLAPTPDPDAVPMRWLWPGRISLGGITVLDSVFDHEKRLLAFDLAARVSTGRPMPDGLSKPEAPGHVVLLIHRLLSHTVGTRLEAAGADLSHVTHGSCEVDDLLPGADRKAMSRSIPEGTKLVVIDPLVCPAVASFPVPKGGGAARAALVRLAELAEQTGAAMLLLRDLHVGSDPDPRSSDSSVLEILGVARTRLIVVRNGDDKHGMVLASTPPDLGGGVGPQPYSLAPDDQHVPIVWGGPGKLRTTVPPERADGGAAPASKVDVAGQLLLKWLAAKPLPAKVVMQRAAAAGITEPTLRRAKSRYHVISHKRGGPGGVQEWWWSLEDDHSAH
jgi:hypothetical protein